jgi:protein tyrosine phosphatase (PTP) superfamily phosphohydrolase (DUF442 family)
MVKPGIEVLFSAQPVVASRIQEKKINTFLLIDINKPLLARCQPGWPVYVVVLV